MTSIRRLRSTSARFSHSEVKKLEELFHTSKADVLDAEFHKNLTDEFNGTRSRQCNELKVEDMRKWFLSKHKQQESPARFSQSDVRKLEKLLHEIRDDLYNEEFHQKLADEFNHARDRRSKILKGEDVRKWFLARRIQRGWIRSGIAPPLVRWSWLLSLMAVHRRALPRRPKMNNGRLHFDRPK